MTDRLDLDDLDAGEPDEDDAPNPGDWFWRGDGDPGDAPAGATEAESAPDTTTAGSSAVDSSTAEESDATESEDAETPGADRPPMPRVPRENEDRPAGIPTDSGGAGAGTGSGAGVEADSGTTAGTDTGSGGGADGGAGEASDAASRSASGPHGGGADDMTLAFTYGAATRLSNFGAAAADADGWADWVGLVGRVPAHVINKFQRDRRVDLDFFNGSARGPGERLADVGPTSMFYAERMVVVGVEGEDEEIAEAADWEFVPLAEAAEKAGWEVEDGDDGAERAGAEADEGERRPE